MLFSPTPRKRKRLQLRISERRLLLMFGDTLSILLAVYLALGVWAFVGNRDFSIEFLAGQISWFLLLPTVWFVLASANDYYDLQVASSRSGSLQRLFLIQLQLLVVYLLVFFLSERTALPRLFILYYGGLSFAFITLWRLLNPALVGWASVQRRVLIVGTDWAAKTIVETLQNEAKSSYEILGIIGENGAVGTQIANVSVIGSGRDLLNYVLRDNIKELVLTSTRELQGEVFQGVMDAYERGVTITPMPLLYERITGRVPIEHVNNNWSVVLPIGTETSVNPYPFLKRIMDVLLSIVGLFVFVLIAPFIALVIKLDSRGSVFFTQRRVGRNGYPFNMIKFRTMAMDAEKETGAVFAQANDPRVTRVGKILRKTRLDELPQLVNVLKGEMSLVGPRPERPEHVKRLQEKIPFYRTRHVVRPGVTGWAQVRYPYGANDEDAMAKLQYDLYYIRHQSLALDVNIIIRTVGKVLRMAGQ